MLKSLQWFVLLISPLLLASCVETQAIEEIGIINAKGIDIADENLMELTFVVFQFSPQSQEITKTITGKGKTIDGAFEDANHTAVFPLARGKIKVSLYGREMAEQGILSSLDSQVRDARIPDRMYLSVSDTTAKDILNVNQKEIAMDSGQYLHGLIHNHSTDHNIPRKTLQDFLRIYYDVGQDNAVPIFEMSEDIPKIKGIALFKGDKMVGEITNEEVILLNLMNRTVKERIVEMTLPIKPFKDYLRDKEEHTVNDVLEIAVEIQKGRSHTKLIDTENLIFETHTDLSLRIIEQSAGITIKEQKVLQLFKNEIEKNMKERFNKLIIKLQKMESDPFGYGRYYKRTEKGKNITNDEWQQLYPSIEVKFNVNVEIITHGTTD